MQEIFSKLNLDDHGIYRSKDTNSVAYPIIGNQDCFLLEDDSYWFKHRNQCITSVISNHPPSGPIIDVGGGNGYVTRGILDAGFNAVLVEPGLSGATNGKIKREIPEVICATFSNINFKASSISAIGCFDVIEHIENDEEIIDDFFQKLKPGGLLYITLPAHKWLWSQSDVRAQHYRRYDRKQVEKLLSKRFEIIYFTYFFSLLLIPIFIFRALPYRLMGRKDSVLSRKTEHGTNKGIIAKLINYFLRREIKKLRNGRSITYGASCLIVARKIN